MDLMRNDLPKRALPRGKGRKPHRRLFSLPTHPGRCQLRRLREQNSRRRFRDRRLPRPAVRRKGGANQASAAECRAYPCGPRAGRGRPDIVGELPGRPRGSGIQPRIPVQAQRWPVPRWLRPGREDSRRPAACRKVCRVPPRSCGGGLQREVIRPENGPLRQPLGRPGCHGLRRPPPAGVRTAASRHS